MTVDKLIEILTLIVFVAPVVLELVKYLGAATTTTNQLQL